MYVCFSVISTYSTDYDELFRSKQIVYASDDKTAAIMNSLHPHRKPLTVSKEALTHALIGMGFRKGSPLVKSVNKYIQRIGANGLFDHWKLVDVHRYNSKFESQPPVAITFSDLSAIFLICGVLHFIASIVCASEIFISYTRDRWSLCRFCSWHRYMRDYIRREFNRCLEYLRQN